MLLVAAGIAPFATLWHFDPLQALQDEGGFQHRDTAKVFGDYASYVAEKLSDRIRHFFTINEFQSFTDAGHRGAANKVGGGVVRVEMAPGLKLAPGALHQVRHHTVLAHGLAVQAIHTQGKQGTQRGPAEVLSTAVPLIESPEHIAAAARATRERNASFMTVMLAGQYTDAYLENAGKDGSGLHSAVEHDCSVIAHETDVHSASDGFQRSLRARFQARLTPRVRLQNCFLDSEAW